MPRKAQQMPLPLKAQVNIAQPRKAKPKDDWAGFVPCEISEQEKGEFLQWAEGNTEAVWDSVDSTLATGIKLSLTYDGANQCYIASYSGRPDVAGEIEFNAVLTARSGTIGEATALLVYKHTVLLQYDWWEVINTPKVNKRAFG